MKMRQTIFRILAISLAFSATNAQELCNPRDKVRAEWERHHEEMVTIIKNGGMLYKPSADMDKILKIDPDLAKRGIGNDDKAHALDLQAFYHDTDKNPVDIVLRRTRALLDHLSKNPQWKGDRHFFQSQIDAVGTAYSAADNTKQMELYLELCRLRRSLAFSNPVLNFDKLLMSSLLDVTGSLAKDMVPGGNGIWMADQVFTDSPKINNIFEGKTIEGGRHKGKLLSSGFFRSPDLSFDAKKILFNWSPNPPNSDWDKNKNWDKDWVWHIFEANIDGTACRQLTDGDFWDLDPCYLPNGRIVFTSYRRSPDKVPLFLRCNASLPFIHTLHSCAADGSDIVTLSYHDLPEYQPSVDFDGTIVFTRWEYYEKASHWTGNLWKCFSDGRDPRAPHGNYYLPHQTFDRTAWNGKASGFGNPMMEYSIRAIPGSSGKYTATASCVHGGNLGTLVMIDLKKRDDFGMGQVARLTPELFFPESENGNMAFGLGERNYGYAWPVSEDIYICSYAGNICYLDRFGNREPLIFLDEVPGAKPKQNVHGRWGLADPIPLSPRPSPPDIPTQTYDGERNKLEYKPATIKIMNIYESSLPWPAGVEENKRIKWLRILQVFPKYNDMRCAVYGIYATISGAYYGRTGYPAGVDYGVVNGPRIPLGVVPVEDDGSVYCYAPVNKAIFFQALDENGMAIQHMRSATYIHAGEQMSCLGCHEDKWKAPNVKANPMAFRREPSILKTEVASGAVPYNFHVLAKPVFQKSCIPCHTQAKKGPVKMDYWDLERFAFCFKAPRSIGGVDAQGSHTIPGHFGALASKMGKALLNPTHQEAKRNGLITEDDFRRVVLWLDCNSSQFGTIYSVRDVLDQIQGQDIYPIVDFKAFNPLGMEIYRGDTTPPTKISGLNAKSAIFNGKLGVAITWSASEDAESGIGCYAVYKNGEFLSYAPRLTYTDYRVLPGEEVFYGVIAINRNGLESERSDSISVALPFDSNVPHIVRFDHSDPEMGVTASSSSKPMKIAWAKTVTAQDTKYHHADPWNTVNGSGLSGSIDLKAAMTAQMPIRDSFGYASERKPQVVNCSALSGDKESHACEENSMWISKDGDVSGAWIEYDLGRPYLLTKLHIWNANADSTCGIKEAEFLVSLDGKEWNTTLPSVTLQQASGKPDYVGEAISLNQGVVARKVKILVKSNHGGKSAGLSELQFHYGDLALINKRAEESTKK